MSRLSAIWYKLAVWEKFPDALFALVKTAAVTATDETEEFHLGAFELQEGSLSRESRGDTSSDRDGPRGPDPD